MTAATTNGVGRGVLVGSLCVGLFAAGCGLISGASDLTTEGPKDNAGENPSSASASSSSSSSASSSGSSSGSPATSTSSSASSASSSSGDPGSGDLLSCTASGLLAFWKIDEGSGTVVNDCGPNKANATLTAGLSWVTGRNGKGSALEFTGNNSPGGNLLALDSTAPSTAALNTTGALTVSLWIYKVDDPRGSVIGRAQSLQRTSWALAYEANDLRASIRDNMNNVDLRIEIDNIRANNWHHVALVFRPSTAFEIWHNGNMADSTTRSVPATLPNYGALKVGHIDDPNDAFGHLNGRIQQVRLFNRALSPTEISTLASESN